jgi:hypothetical protein
LSDEHCPDALTTLPHHSSTQQQQQQHNTQRFDAGPFNSSGCRLPLQHPAASRAAVNSSSSSSSSSSGMPKKATFAL